MTRLALVLWGVSVALSSLGIVVLVLSASTPIPSRFGFRGSDAILAVVLATVGALIAVRRPHNPVGWLFSAAGLIFAATAFAAEYRVYAVLTRRGSLPLGPEAAWVANWSWSLLLGVITGLFLLFPDGRLPSGRWRPLLWLTGLSTAVMAVGLALEPGPLDEFRVVRNPFGVEVGPVVDLIGSVGILGLVLCLLAAGLSLVLRLRRGRGVQRQQLKWIAYAAAVAATGVAQPKGRARMAAPILLPSLARGSPVSVKRRTAALVVGPTPRIPGRAFASRVRNSRSSTCSFSSARYRATSSSWSVSSEVEPRGQSPRAGSSSSASQSTSSGVFPSQGTPSASPAA